MLDAETEMYVCMSFCIGLLCAVGGMLTARAIWTAVKAAFFYAGERRRKNDPVF